MSTITAPPALEELPTLNLRFSTIAQMDADIAALKQQTSTLTTDLLKVHGSLAQCIATLNGFLGKPTQ